MSRHYVLPSLPSLRALSVFVVQALALPLSAAPMQEERPVVVSFGDHFVIFDEDEDAKLDTPEKIARCMREWRDVHDVTTVYFRTGSWFIRNLCTRVPDSISKYWEIADDIFGRFDPYTAACDAGHELGMEVYGYASIFDEGSPPEILYGDNTPFPWQSHFTIKHPEYLVVDREGKRRQYGVMEYAYPEVRAYKLKELTDFLDEYDYDGIYLCTRSHSKPADQADQFGFGEPVVRAFKERHGVDIRTQEFDLEAWRALRGEFLTQFLREVRAELNRRGKGLAIGIPQGDILGPPYGNMKLDWQTWVREKLVDRIVVGVTSGDWHYPSMRGKDKERGYLASGHEHWGLPRASEAMETIYEPLCNEYGVAVQLGLLNAASIANMRAHGVVKETPQLAFPQGRLTIEAWVKSEGKQDYGRLISQYDHTLPDNSGRGWEVYLEENGEVVFRVNDGENDHALTTKGALPVGKWTHLACVSEGASGRMKVYFDGVPDEVTTAAPTSVRQVPVKLFVGRYPSGGRPFEGWLAELRVSAAARTPIGPPSARLTADEDTLILWQPAAEGDLVKSGGTVTADLQLVKVRTREPGPLDGLTAIRIGERRRGG